MKKIVIVIVIVVIVVLIGIIYFRSGNKTVTYTNQPNQTNTNTPMKISSPAFVSGEAIPKKYTCDDIGVNPPLEISDVPAQAQSLALIIDDPDAPAGTWTHWVVWNIPPDTKTIAENSVPPTATVGQASSGQNVYGSLCPPSGIHHYYFKLYALPNKLTLSSFSDVAVLQKAMDGNVIATAELMGTYSRP